MALEITLSVVVFIIGYFIGRNHFYKKNPFLNPPDLFNGSMESKQATIVDMEDPLDNVEI